ncbi:MAG: addiction module protein [Azovibrio sp.]|uniref:addiction module protein n=1 Tax=Azovibrio sp. TaxID=1872673 RepID=UPI003C72FA19
MGTQEIIEQALKLKATERFEIVEQILQSLDKPDQEIERIWADEAGRRLQIHDAGQVQGIPLDEALKGL